MKRPSANVAPPSPLSMERLLAADRRHVWHPYASMTKPAAAYPVVSASGVHIRLADGRELVDGISSWWTAIHGYGHPVLIEAARKQLESMSHVMFGGLTHAPAVELASLLAELTPGRLETVFFCDSGSVAVEVAVKMAIQYWHARGSPGKNRLVTIRSGYHGDTFLAMSLCDPVEGMHAIFRGVLPEHYFADAPRSPFGGPWDNGDIESIERIIAGNADTIAAAVMEPIVQAAGGMRFYSEEYLRRVRELCDRHGVLLILDEVATGFGRTGLLFASEHAGVAPDIMCLGKALTGGLLGLAAAVTTEEVARTISEGAPGLFMHGPTFMANPLACAVSLASARLLLSQPWREIIRAIEEGLRAGLEPCRCLPGVKDVRVLGDIGAVELERPVDQEGLTAAFVERGAWVRPFGSVIYLIPPYIISGNDLSLLTGAVVDVVREGPI